MTTFEGVKLGRVAHTVSGVGFPHEYQGRTTGDIPFLKVSDLSGDGNRNGVSSSANWVSKIELHELGARVAPAGSVVFPKIGAALLKNTRKLLLRPAAMDNNLMGVWTSLGDARFLKYALSLVDLGEFSGSGPLPYVSDSQVREIQLPWPPAGEQQRIADFLDVETKRVDDLLVRRLGQRDVLRDREIAVIASVLSGQDVEERPGPPTWSWLNELPRKWVVGPVYAYFDVQLGKMLNPERASGDHPCPYMRNANVHWYEVDTGDVAMMSFDPDERRRYSLLPGDLLVCEGGAGVAEAAVWNGDFGECYYQKSLHRARSRAEAPVEWLMFWLRLVKHVGVLEAEGNLATIPHLTGEQIRRMRIPIAQDMADRVNRLKGEIAQMKTVLSTLSRADLLGAERRQALITAAVTGQIDVTTARGVEA